MSENLHKPDCICVTCEDARNATVTVDRQEWERMQAESEAWRATRSEWDRSITLQHAWRSTGRVIAQQIEILDSLTPSNAVEEGST